MNHSHHPTSSHRAIPSLVRYGCFLKILVAVVMLAGYSSSALADGMTNEPFGDNAGLVETVEAGVAYLLDFCNGDVSDREIDLTRIDPMISFIAAAEEMAVQTPRPRDSINGAFIAYTLDRSLKDALRYAYNQKIPEGAINASSVRYAQWERISAGESGPPELWKMVDDLSQPQVVRGAVREIISPDLHTGAYYEYGLNRAFLLYRRGDQRVTISISSQMGESEVGRKGFIVGDDTDWNYLYTQTQGLDKTGLGWVKSRIYDFLSVCAYVEDLQRPGQVKVGIFQWLGAGWAGFNLVESHHIHKGMVRQTSQFKALLESKRIPPPVTLERIYHSLSKIDEEILREKVAAVARYVRDKARSDRGLRKKKEIADFDPEEYVAQMDRHQLVSELMREFMKFSLGKETPLSSSFWVSLKQRGPSEALPLS